MENTPPPMQPQPVPPVQSYAPQPMPPARSHGPVIAAVVVGIIVLAGAAFAYTKLVNKPAETASPTPSVSASATPDTTANWKTYTSSKFGYSVQYPSPWASTVKFDQGSQSQVAIQGSEGSITIFENFDFGGGACSSVGTLTQISTGAGSFMGCVTPDGLTVSGDSGFLSHNNNRYVLRATWTTSSKQEVIQALSTFSFTTPATTGWKTYTNTQYGFSLKLAPSWSNYTTQVFTEPRPGSLDDVADVQINYNSSVQHDGQTIVINVFTPAQWAAELRKDQPHPQELGRSSAYVFTTPFRYEYSGLPGEADVPSILATFALTGVAASATPAPTAGWKAYTSTLYGYTFSYPTNFTIVYPPAPANMPWDNFVCGSEIGICTKMNDQYAATFQNTNFGGAGFTVKILDKDPENLSTASACATRQQGTENAHTITGTTVIHGTSFYTESFGGAAAGTSVATTIYRAFHGGKCWELAVNQVAHGASDNPAPTAAQMKAIDDALGGMLNSFVFTK